MEGARSDLSGQYHIIGMLTAGEKRGGGGGEGWKEQGVILVDRVTSQGCLQLGRKGGGRSKE